MKKYIILYIILLTGYQAFCQDINFSNNDKICFVGNSITMNGGFYHNVALFYATRYPNKPLVILNKGINGNGAADVIKRMDYDILSEQPTWCVIKLGMNDVIRELYLPETVKDAHNQEQRRQAFDAYKKNIKTIIDTLLKHHVKIILQTPTIYDQTSTMPSLNLKGRNDALKEFAQYIMETGKAMQLKTIDYWDPMFRINNTVQATDPAATIIGPDRVHPDGVGHFVMTYEFLKGINELPLVSEMIINKTKLQTTKAGHNYTLSNFERKKDQVKFICLEKSLPFPIPADAEKALDLVPFTQSFNVELLKVNDLAAGKYTLKIDTML
jgi:lysophospholipase L1-like esterase